jgi:hypothetical protein
MRFESLFWLVLLLSVFLISCNKEESPKPDDYIPLTGSFHAICSNSNNELIIAGMDYPDHPATMILLKTDKLGNQIWEKRYAFDYSTRPCAVLATSHNDFYLLADRIIGDSNIFTGIENWVFKFDNNGDSVFQTVVEPVGEFMSMKMVSSRDGGVLVLMSSMNDDYRTGMAEVSENGQVLWKTYYGMKREDFQIGEYPYGQRYVMFDYPFGYDGDEDSLRINGYQLDMIGQVTIGFSQVQGCLFGKACFAEEQHFLWLGSGGQGVSITKTDFLGNIEWTKSHSLSGTHIAGIERIEPNRGSNYALGYYNNGTSRNNNLFILKFNNNGGIEKFTELSLGNIDASYVDFTGLPNGNIAVIYPVGDPATGGTSGLGIY